MSIIISDIKLKPGAKAEEAFAKAISVLKIPREGVISADIAKCSVDARKKDDIRLVYSVELAVSADEEKLVADLGSQNIRLKKRLPLQIAAGTQKLTARPVVIGFGPAGIFAALLLAKEGYRPIVIEKGGTVEEREQKVARFWQSGELDEGCNVQFGEGGAGTFSDGKLTTRIGDPLCDYVLDAFVEHGAPKEILTKARPHVGTDRIRGVVASMRRRIIELGGEVIFNAAVVDIKEKNGAVSAVATTKGEFEASAAVLATGHSARDIFDWAIESGQKIEAKPFSVGVRIEHLQETIDKGLYGALAGHPNLPRGEYQMSWRSGERAVYTFCMCPGGFVVPAASQQGGVVVNGMSYYNRANKNANSALVVSVDERDFGSDPRGAIEFQQRLENAAFAAGGGGYKAPAQDVKSFLNGKKALNIGRVVPSYSIGVAPCDFNSFFSAGISSMLAQGLRRFERVVPGFSQGDGILTGAETRTSSPVRLVRDAQTLEGSFKGLYPCGEGAGYAGGIMSAAVDGLRVALKIIEKYAPLD